MRVEHLQGALRPTLISVSRKPRGVAERRHELRLLRPLIVSLVITSYRVGNITEGVIDPPLVVDNHLALDRLRLNVSMNRSVRETSPGVRPSSTLSSSSDAVRDSDSVEAPLAEKRASRLEDSLAVLRVLARHPHDHLSACVALDTIHDDRH